MISAVEFILIPEDENVSPCFNNPNLMRVLEENSRVEEYNLFHLSLEIGMKFKFWKQIY